MTCVPRGFHAVRSRTLCWLATATMLWAAPLAAQTSAFVSFDAPDGGTGSGQGTRPTAINQNGVIGGFYIDQGGLLHGFVRHANGQITEFDAPIFSSTTVTGINRSGQIVGYGSIISSLHGFLRSASGKFTKIEVSGSTDTLPSAINDNGEITGTYYDPAGLRHGFLRDAGGNYTLFDEPNAGNNEHQGTFAVAINGSGEIAGYYQDVNDIFHGFIRDQLGNFTSFDAPGAGTRVFTGTTPGAINLSGEITGYFSDDNLVTHAFVRDTSGSVTVFDAPGSTLTLANAINDNGKVLGYWMIRHSTRGFVRNSVGKLNSYSVPVSGANTYPAGINNGGLFTGAYAVLRGPYHGFLD
jgi:hypothetical protein